MGKLFKSLSRDEIVPPVEPVDPPVDPIEELPPDEGESLPVPPADVTDADHQIGQGATPHPTDPAVIDPLGHLDDVAQEMTPPVPGAGLPTP